MPGVHAGGHCRQFLPQIGITTIDLGSERLVLRGQTLHRIGDPAIPQAQSIVQRQRLWPIAETETIEGFVQEDARMVAREGTPGGIGPMHPWRQPDDQQSRTGVPERGNRSCVIFGKLQFDLLEEISQSLATAASVKADCHLNSASLSKPWR